MLVLDLRGLGHGDVDGQNQRNNPQKDQRADEQISRDQARPHPESLGRFPSPKACPKRR